jgi:glycosyltransferase involved in cell wall biosynthesis
MKKRIIFCVRDFFHGGIPKCLQQLLLLIDTSRYDIDVFCGDQSGPYRNMLPNCNILKEDFLLWSFFTNYRKQTGWRKIAAIGVKLMSQGLLRVGFDWLDWKIEKIANSLSKTDYTAVIAFSDGISARLVSSVSTIPNKIVWIHNDYGFDCARGDKLDKIDFQKFNHIVCVSNHTEIAFRKAYPSLSGKTIVIYNVIDSLSIRLLSEETIEADSRFKEDHFTIVSVGRVSAQKQFNRIPKIAHQLLAHGLNFVWYIIGNGPDEEVKTVMSEINNYNVSDKVILLGAKDNPYTFMARSNLLVLTSLYESYPTVINEAKILGIPIVTTNYGSASELVDESCGLILPIEELATGIEKMITDVSLYNKFKNGLSSFEYNNAELLDRIYEIIDCN